MSRQRFVGLLMTAALTLAGAFYLSTQRNQTHEGQGAPLLPTLASELNAVSEVQVRKGSATPAVTLHKSGKEWTVAERQDFPADVTKLRKLLMALADAKIVEEKTSDPARYAVIGVDDPAQPGATGAEIRIIAPNGPLAVIVGKPVGEGNFVRRVGEKQSFSIEPAVSLETEPRSWIETRLLDLQSTAIQTMTVTLDRGAGYALHRAPSPSTAADRTAKPAEAVYALDAVPTGRQALDAVALAPSATLFTNLTVEDVAPVGDVDFSHASHLVVTFSDGKVLNLTGAVAGDKHWIEVSSIQDAALQAKTNGRAFEIASYRYDAIFRPLEQLLVPKAPAAAAKARAATTGAATKSAPPGQSSGATKRPATAPAS